MAEVSAAAASHDPVARVWGWVGHLRGGGTTAWNEWTGTGAPTGPVVPGAQQLELVRRLNHAGRPAPELVERVLATSTPGRGQPDLPVGESGADSRFGPAPVDPGALPARELLRVATAVIAEDLVAAGPPEPVARPRALPWRRHYRLGGDPELVSPAARSLAAARRPPGDKGPVLLLAAPVDRLLADAWTHRAFGVGAPRWRSWLDDVVEQDRLPARVDLLELARRWERLVGRRRVHLVLDHAALAHLVGSRRPVHLPGPLPAPAADLSRRVAPLLGLLVPSPERAVLLREVLRPALAGASGPPPQVPHALQDWMEAQARGVAHGVRRGGYRVHGDLGQLLPRAGAREKPAGDDATLALAVRLLLADRLRRATTDQEDA